MAKSFKSSPRINEKIDNSLPMLPIEFPDAPKNASKLRKLLTHGKSKGQWTHQVSLLVENGLGAIEEFLQGGPEVVQEGCRLEDACEVWQGGSLGGNNGRISAFGLGVGFARAKCALPIDFPTLSGRHLARSEDDVISTYEQCPGKIDDFTVTHGALEGYARGEGGTEMRIVGWSPFVADRSCQFEDS